VPVLAIPNEHRRARSIDGRRVRRNAVCGPARLLHLERAAGPDARRGCQEDGDKLLLAVNGSMLVAIDDGTRRRTIPLDDPSAGLLIPSRIWCAISQFSERAVLAVFASLPYDEPTSCATTPSFSPSRGNDEIALTG
jgi:hypothetical protein